MKSEVMPQIVAGKRVNRGHGEPAPPGSQVPNRIGLFELTNRVAAVVSKKGLPGSCTVWNMTEMPISEARDHISELVGRARYAGQETILTHYGVPVAAVISIEEYQRLKNARGDADSYELPTEIMAQVEESRRHPERDQPRPRRARGSRQ